MTARLAILAPLVAMVALASCSVVPGAQPLVDQGRETAEGAADDLIDAAIWHMCYASSVGSVRREFGTSAERAELYHALCETPGAVLPVEPNLSP